MTAPTKKRSESAAGVSRGSQSGALLRKSREHSRVMVWAFADAPKALRSLHRTSPPPEWIVFVPQHLIGSDLEEIITRNAESTGLFRYETATQGIVYMGSSPVESPSILSLAATSR